MSCLGEVQELQALVDPKNLGLLHALGGLKGLANKLHSDLENGISTNESSKLTVSDRIKRYGANRLPEALTKSFFELIKDGFEDKTLLVLIGAALVSLTLGLIENPSTGWIEGLAIMLAVAIVVTVTAVNDYQKEKQFRKLNAKKEDRLITCIRDGSSVQVNVHELVVGDLVALSTGFAIPVDGVLIFGHNVSCDESKATGESELIRKTHEKDPFLLSGTMVMEGAGMMIVTSVGESSFFGKILMSLRVEAEPTPLQKKLETLADQIAQFGMWAAIITVSCLMVKTIFLSVYRDSEPNLSSGLLSKLLGFVITGITIVVVAVPEGLPLAVTMALAYSTMKMLEDQNLVRKLEACETMGGASVICSDKTGTLTLNQMTVVEGRIGCKHFEHRISEHHHLGDASIDSSEDLNQSLITSISNLELDPLVRDILMKVTCCNSTVVRSSGQLVGSTTEVALVNFITDLINIETANLPQNNNNSNNSLLKKRSSLQPFDFKAYRDKYEVAIQYPFSSKAKKMFTVIRRTTGDLLLLATGAAELILETCDFFMDETGDVDDINRDLVMKLQSDLSMMACKALRNIGMGYAHLAADTDLASLDPTTVRLTLVGVVGIMDPVRIEVPLAVAQCQSAGIAVKMVTGDSLHTAKAIAAQCGIYEEGDLVMEGPDFRKLDLLSLDEAASRLVILARSSPLDKLLLVNSLKKQGEIIAVTGDGTNDGPALKSAHVGFSMGITGTDVAKEASDIILMDDNFCSIVKATLWGRNVYDSIRKFLQFQLTVNVAAVTMAFIGSVVSETGESPLKPVQLLWVNLIMDTLAALALATEPPQPDLLNRLPYSANESLISKNMVIHIAVQSVYQCLALGSVLYLLPAYSACPSHMVATLIGEPMASHSKLHLTLFFNTFVLCQVANKINCRRIHSELNMFSMIFENPLFVFVLALIVGVQVLFINYAGEFGGTIPLTVSQWGLSVCFAIVSIPLSFATKVAVNLNTCGSIYHHRTAQKTSNKIKSD